MRLFNSLILLSFLSFSMLTCKSADGHKEKTITFSKIGSSINLGVLITNLSDSSKADLRVQQGARVLHVMEDSEAEKIGLLKDDVIISFDGTSIQDATQLNDIVEAIEDEKAVSLTVVRKGDEKTFDALLKPSEDDNVFSYSFSGDGDDWIWHSDKGENLTWITEGDDFENINIEELADIDEDLIKIGERKGGFLGVETKNISEQMLEYFEVKNGVQINKVIKDSPAEKAGLKAGDVIVKIEDRKITDYKDLVRTLNYYNADEEVKIEFVRKGTPKNIKVKLAKKSGSRIFIGKNKDGFIVPSPHMHIKKNLKKLDELKGFKFKHGKMNIYLI